MQPMLAADYRTGCVDFPVDVQPKLNGLRCMVSGGDFILRSRSGMSYQVPAVEQELRCVLQPGIVFDGELYVHGVPLQEIQSLVAAGSDRVQFHIFDVIVCDEDAWEFRSLILARLAKYSANLPHIRCVDVTHNVQSHEKLLSLRDSYVRDGYEGAIIRLLGSAYTPGRSAGLLKFKPSQDAEFQIVDVLSAKGAQAGCAIFACRSESGKTFKVVPAWSLDERRMALSRRSDLIGKRLTVKFAGRSNSGTPLIAQGIAIRSMEDMPCAIDLETIDNDGSSYSAWCSPFPYQGVDLGAPHQSNPDRRSLANPRA